MNKVQRERFRRGGWKLGTVGDLLDLTPAEEALIEMKVRLGGVVRTLRQHSRLSQADLAKKIGSSQPRVAKIENQDPEVSLDLPDQGNFCVEATGTAGIFRTYPDLGVTRSAFRRGAARKVAW